MNKRCRELLPIGVAIPLVLVFAFLNFQCGKKTESEQPAQETKVSQPDQTAQSGAGEKKENNQTAVEAAAPTGDSAATAVAGSATGAESPAPYTGEGAAANFPDPPRKNEKEFVEYMKTNRGEDSGFLSQRYVRAMSLVRNKDLYRDKEIKAFLMTPREKFCRKWNLKRAYEHAFLDIGYGVTISGPYLVGRMTSALDVQPGEKVLEIGTGSGYQSAILSYLTDYVYTIEIIEDLEKVTDDLYTELTPAGYPEYGKIKRKADDGYYGWEEFSPFDKIIVTCGIDHIPPDLLKQLKIGGVMVIPVGPPGAQVVLKVTKQLDADGDLTITREDIYKGRMKVPFVPFTKKGGGTHFEK